MIFMSEVVIFVSKLHKTPVTFYIGIKQKRNLGQKLKQYLKKYDQKW